MSWFERTSLRFGLATCTAFAFMGCGSGDEPALRDVVTSQQPLLGGLPARSRVFDAVGVFFAPAVVDQAGICTAVLIGPTTVLTAKHCAMGAAPFLSAIDVYFATGPDVNAPRALYPVVGVEWETDVPADPDSLLAKVGCDVAVAHLARPVEGVVPWPIGRLSRRDVGAPFAIIGYGEHKARDDFGQRRAGVITLGGIGGNYADYAFGGFDGFVEAAKSMPRFSGLDREQLASDYEQLYLIPEYQAYFGGRPWNAQACGGDSGAPVIALRPDGWHVVGLAGQGDYESKRQLCDYGSVVSIFGPLMRAFIERELDE